VEQPRPRDARPALAAGILLPFGREPGHAASDAVDLAAGYAACASRGRRTIERTHGLSCACACFPSRSDGC
jgi:hypothetical protein